MGVDVARGITCSVIALIKHRPIHVVRYQCFIAGQIYLTWNKRLLYFSINLLMILGFHSMELYTTQYSMLLWVNDDDDDDGDVRSPRKESCYARTFRTRSCQKVLNIFTQPQTILHLNGWYVYSITCCCMNGCIYSHARWPIVPLSSSQRGTTLACVCLCCTTSTIHWCDCTCCV